MNLPQNDQELLESFKNPVTKEQAFTGIIKNTRRNYIGISGER